MDDDRAAVILASAHPIIARRFLAVQASMLALGWRVSPIGAWRSTARQLEHKLAGRSRVTWGLHNATAPDGSPESLAIDYSIEPLEPLICSSAAEFRRTRALVYLAAASVARRHWLRSGAEWSLRGEWADYSVGWDPAHLEAADCPSYSAARQGWRPKQ